MQLTPSLSEGYTITLRGNTGTLLVGKPVIASTSVVLPLLAENGTYPNGHPAYQRDVTLCWTVGTVRGCGLTNIDSGLFGLTEANTGIGFFFANSVGFDVSTGHVVLTPH